MIALYFFSSAAGLVLWPLQISMVAHMYFQSKSDIKLSVFFPAKNEQDTIEGAILNAKQSIYKPSNVVVIDAYSTDNTVELAKKAGAIVIQQSKQMFPGKCYWYNWRRWRPNYCGYDTWLFSSY